MSGLLLLLLLLRLVSNFRRRRTLLIVPVVFSLGSSRNGWARSGRILAAQKKME